MVKLCAADVIKMARNYKNWQEKSRIGTRAQMWDFHWSPGYHNYTIWAMLYQDYTERNYQGQPWCAMYGTVIMVLALMETCGMKLEEAVSAARELFGGDMPYNCQEFVTRHQGDKRMNHSPAPGAMVIFWTGKKYGHWGICSGTDKNGTGYTSVEGNTSGGEDKVDPDGGAVCEKWHNMDKKTLFWHPDYEREEEPEPEQYRVMASTEGLSITADSLCMREYPETGRILDYLKKDEMVYPEVKRFVNGKAWYWIQKEGKQGWISARYLRGWVYEDCKRWWYVMPGYQFTVSDWQWIGGSRYYFDNTGYMASSQWILDEGDYYYATASGQMARNEYIKSAEKEWYYWVDSDGIWQPEKDTDSPDRKKYKVFE